MCFIYWFIRLCKYVKVNATTELKPYDEFYYPSTLFESYVFFIKTQTVYKAYLNSFATIYNILKTLQQGSKSKKTTLLTLLKLLVKTILWLFIKFITSLPRTVILDSYWCSRFFWRVNNHNLCKYGWSRIIEEVGDRFYDKVIFYVSDALVPLMFLRIYKSNLSNFNFNPNKIQKLTEYYNWGRGSANIHDLVKYISQSDPSNFLKFKSIINEKILVGEIRSSGAKIFHKLSYLDFNKEGDLRRTNTENTPTKSSK